MGALLTPGSLFPACDTSASTWVGPLLALLPSPTLRGQLCLRCGISSNLGMWQCLEMQTGTCGGRLPQSQVQGGWESCPAFPRETPQTVLWEDVFLPPPYLIRRLPDQFHTVNIILPSFWEKGMTQAPGSSRGLSSTYLSLDADISR